MMDIWSEWEKRLAVPEDYIVRKKSGLIRKFEYEKFDAFLYWQNNGPGTRQRVLKVVPKNLAAPAPSVIVPFYFPEAMIGFELETGEKLPKFAPVTLMADLAEKGVITISADSYHLTYLDLELDRNDFSRWRKAGSALKEAFPSWCGVGKLMADTRLLLDILDEEPLADPERIGIAGHSLGGKMAFYAGCFEPRIKAMLTSDFGFCYEQSNWEEIWYWGQELEELKEKNMQHWQLLEYSGNKPFALLAGMYDNDASLEMILQAEAYRKEPQRLLFINHATGHRPPRDVLEKGYEFLLKNL